MITIVKVSNGWVITIDFGDATKDRISYIYPTIELAVKEVQAAMSCL